MCCLKHWSVRRSSSSARPLNTRAPAGIGERSDGEQVGLTQIRHEQPVALLERLFERGDKVGVRRHDDPFQLVVVA